MTGCLLLAFELEAAKRWVQHTLIVRDTDGEDSEENGPSTGLGYPFEDILELGRNGDGAKLGVGQRRRETRRVGSHCGGVERQTQTATKRVCACYVSSRGLSPGTAPTRSSSGSSGVGSWEGEEVGGREE